MGHLWTFIVRDVKKLKAHIKQNKKNILYIKAHEQKDNIFVGSLSETKSKLNKYVVGLYLK